MSSDSAQTRSEIIGCTIRLIIRLIIRLVIDADPADHFTVDLDRFGNCFGIITACDGLGLAASTGAEAVTARFEESVAHGDVRWHTKG